MQLQTQRHMYNYALPARTRHNPDLENRDTLLANVFKQLRLCRVMSKFTPFETNDSIPFECDIMHQEKKHDYLVLNPENLTGCKYQMT